MWDRLMAFVGTRGRRPGRMPGLRPVASLRQVQRFEERFGVTLPESYRTYITTVGDGFEDRYNGLIPFESSYTASHEAAHPGFLATPFPHTRGIDADDFDDAEEDFLVTGSMSIAVLRPHVLARLIVTGEAAGQVWEDGISDDGFLRPGPDFAVWIRAFEERFGIHRAEPDAPQAE